MFTHRHAVLSASALALLSGSAFASPALDIRVPPVISNFPSGPSFDPSSAQGQWFLPISGANPEVRTHELYDNIAGDGGGPNNYLAIRGRVINFLPGPAGTIGGYVIRASITNNTPSIQGPWAPGRNLHQENLFTGQPYVGTMYSVKLTTHWADDGILGNFQSGGPNLTSPGTPLPTGEANTYAVNYDQLGWYSWAPGSPNTQPAPTGPGQPNGDFQVPTFDFGDIQVGQTVTRDLQFNFYNPVNLSQINTDIVNAPDIFINRSRDLKIGAYFQADPVLNFITDPGTAYPFGGLPGSAVAVYGNVSVFFNVPTPGAGVLVGLGGVLALRRRRR
jgi:hypothetical protein